MFRVRHSEAVRQVRHFPTHLRKMAKCMIYIGTYAWGKCYGKCLTCLTASPRRPRPLDGSVINGTIQQLLDTPRAEPVTANLAGTPHSADVVSSTRMWQGTPQRPHSATQRPDVVSPPDIHEDVARHPQRPHSATQPRNVASSARMRQGHHSGLSGAGAGHFSPLGNLEKQSKGINP